MSLKNKAFINLTYELSNIRVYYINHEFFTYVVDAENIIPIVDKRAPKIATNILNKIGDSHLTNLIFAYPNTINETKKKKIIKLCGSKFLTQRILTNMLLLLINRPLNEI